MLVPFDRNFFSIGHRQDILDNLFVKVFAQLSVLLWVLVSVLHPNFHSEQSELVPLGLTHDAKPCDVLFYWWDASGHEPEHNPLEDLLEESGVSLGDLDSEVASVFVLGVLPSGLHSCFEQVDVCHYVVGLVLILEPMNKRNGKNYTENSLTLWIYCRHRGCCWLACVGRCSKLGGTKLCCRTKLLSSWS